MTGNDANVILHAVSELNGSDRLNRIRLFANHILAFAVANHGTISRNEVTILVSEELGTTVDQVRYGIVYGEGNRMFERSSDGNTLIVKALPTQADEADEREIA